MKLTPLALELLIRACVYGDGISHEEATKGPSQREILSWFNRAGIVDAEMGEVPNLQTVYWVGTEKGKAWLEAILSTPMPGEPLKASPAEFRMEQLTSDFRRLEAKVVTKINELEVKLNRMAYFQAQARLIDGCLKFPEAPKKRRPWWCPKRCHAD